MDIPVLNADYRIGVGKNSAHRTRKIGQVPGVLYDSHLNKLIGIDKKELETILSQYGQNALVNVRLGDTTIKTIIKEVQHDPVNRQVTHVDFKPVSENTKIRTHIPIKFIGTDIAERSGGIVQRHRKEVEVECDAGKVPKFLNVDISQLSVGQNIKIQDIEFSEELTVLSKPNEVVVTIVNQSKQISIEEDTETEVIE